MKGFSGFPAGKVRATRLPSLFFSELLPVIDNLAELKVTMYCFWRLNQKEGSIRYVTREEIEADGAFMVGLASSSEEAVGALVDALERATARGTLLHVVMGDGETGRDQIYFANTAKGRAAVESIERGDWQPGDDYMPHFGLEVERPNIFVLYEQNVGPLTPIIADRLRDVEKTYSEEWIREAVAIAVENNKRSLSYINAILERWQVEGKDSGKPGRRIAQDPRRYLTGEYADIVEY